MLESPSRDVASKLFPETSKLLDFAGVSESLVSVYEAPLDLGRGRFGVSTFMKTAVALSRNFKSGADIAV